MPYIYICLYYCLILCSYFHLLFLTLLATRHILQLTMFDDFITTCPEHQGDKKKIFRSPRRKKRCRVNYNQNKCSNIIKFGTKYELFLFPYQVTFFLAFCQAKIFFSYHILTNILIYVLFCGKKNLLTIFHTETYH